ncbi:ATP synthase subunit C [Oceanispirochaeta sp.]|jgi:V/A-type H+-transporting ATPase subunit K|uniref:ATP synthase subunit C n=1 Tax=Oceanispirochaeta sp. TaxID=2035350 RepID=UPI002603FBE5|nr:ATP synthase subunit C [Oceanispirochaeta sp.]MDA3958964.1 ATP synthase subunit C [Oceanispirochaeta sp.]
MNAQSKFKRLVSLRMMFMLVIMAILFLLSVSGVFAQTAEAATVPTVAPEVQKFGLIAAAIAFGMGAIGAGIAISSVGAAAMGAIGEKPEIAGQALIFIALAEGLVVFGFITALMILGKI